MLYGHIKHIPIGSDEEYDDSVLKQIVKYTKNESLLKALRFQKRYHMELDVSQTLYDLKVKKQIEQLIK